MAAGTAWGIDVGNRALKAVKLVRDAGGVRIDDFAVIEHETVLSNAGDNRETLVQTSLANFVQTHSTKGLPVAVGVSGQASFARFIKLPPVETKKIPEIVKFEAIQQIPFPLDDVEWSYQLFQDENSPDIEVGIFAMRKEAVNQHIKFFTDAGLNVQAVQMNPLSVYNAAHFDQLLKGATLIIDLGAENADLIITEGETVWLRSIPIGGNNFTEALVKSFKLKFEKAEELKRNAATSKYGRQILQAMRPIFADLVAEIQRSIGFYSSVHRESRIAHVLALGGTFRLPGLQKYLQQNLSLDVQKIDMLGQSPPTDGKVAAALNENVLSSVGAYGLALQAMGDAKITSSLLPEAIRKEKMWREKTKWFAAAAACMVAGTGLAYGRYYVEKAKFDQAANTRTEIQQAVQQGQGLSDDWKKIQDDGANDRKQIVDVIALASFRETWPEVYKAIEQSLPKVDAATTRSTRRDARVQVVLDDIKVAYAPDMNGMLAATDDQFNGLVAPRTFYTPGDTSARRSIGTAAKMIAAPAGTPPPADPTAIPRGFVMTLHTMTPHADGPKLVNTTLVQELKKQAYPPPPAAPAPGGPAGAAAAEPAAAPAAGAEAPPAPPPTPRLFSVARVTIPTAIRLANDPNRLRNIEAQNKAAADRKARMSTPGVLLPQGMSIAPGVVPTTPAPPAMPSVTRPPGFPPNPTAPGATPTTPGGTDVVNYLVDPITGEDIRDDWDVVVLVAVVLDPKPPVAAAPAH